MSGGAFNNVSVTDPLDGDAWPSDEHERIVEALEALAEKPEAERVAEIARACLDMWRNAMREVSNGWRRLGPVLRAVEWYHSGDGAAEGVDKAIAEFLRDNLDGK
jgi:hypothetical protein